MNFQEVVTECAMNEHFVHEFNRLRGTNISFKDSRKPIERMIDKATGYPYPFKDEHEDIMKFFDFVFEFIWLPLLAQRSEEND